ncbi:MAG: tripartite tricarboxylate transporter TctB family protein [Sulfitobacter sp.]
MRVDNSRPKKKVGADLIIPVLASLYAIYYVASVWDFPPEAQRSGIFLASLLLFLTSLFLIRTVVRVVQNRLEWEFASVLGPREGRDRRLGFFLLIIGYLLIVQWGGFTLTTFLFLLFGSMLAGLTPFRKAVLFAGVSSLGGWLFFIVILGTRFPRGPFEKFVTWATQSWM